MANNKSSTLRRLKEKQPREYTDADKNKVYRFLKGNKGPKELIKEKTKLMAVSQKGGIEAENATVMLGIIAKIVDTIEIPKDQKNDASL